jgi:APA family basic amino acid/polyamine antiporter
VESRPNLVRQIGLWSAVAVVMGSMIGSGIFRVPAEAAQRLPGPLPLLAVWVAGGLIAICGALTLGEIGGAFPYSGGLYVFIREAYGRLPAFLFGWSNLLSQPASNGAVAIVCSQYALRLFGLKPERPEFAVATAALAIIAVTAVTVANYLGVRFGSFIQNLTTLGKTCGLAVLILLAWTLALPTAGSHFVPAIPVGSFSISMFGLALVPVLFTCDGWMNITYVSGELVDPRRNMPRAVVLGVAAVIAIYLMANVAYLAVLPVAELAKSQVVAAETMSKLVGSWGVAFIGVTVMVSTFGALNAGILSAPRIYFAMSEDRLIFEPLARVHPRYRTPYVAVALTGIQSILYVITATALSGSKAFSALVDACVMFNLPFYAVAICSVFVFRKRERRRATTGAAPLDDSLVDPVSQDHAQTHPHAYSPPVHTPLFPLPPLMFFAAMLFLLGNSLLTPESRVPSLVVLGLVALGVPIYHATIGRATASR